MKLLRDCTRFKLAVVVDCAHRGFPGHRHSVHVFQDIIHAVETGVSSSRPPKSRWGARQHPCSNTVLVDPFLRDRTHENSAIKLRVSVKWKFPDEVVGGAGDTSEQSRGARRASLPPYRDRPPFLVLPWRSRVCPGEAVPAAGNTNRAPLARRGRGSPLMPCQANAFLRAGRFQNGCPRGEVNASRVYARNPGLEIKWSLAAGAEPKRGIEKGKKKQGQSREAPTTFTASAWHKAHEAQDLCFSEFVSSVEKVDARTRKSGRIAEMLVNGMFHVRGGRWESRTKDGGRVEF
ncbi:hypothetical protein B0H17DRAFT_1260856 [Mycena rosella]|uniref:Uncharacterized protein n=1 Tax=Mycena rosella TaxID=1033263 RepID=A0AAD7CRD3_MYCRO|nr:hypothetical protein B0H17DRAFT_1260856 [Mycena rosella]